MELHKFLKFGSFVVLLDLPKYCKSFHSSVWHNIFCPKFSHCEVLILLGPLPKLVMEPNCACLLLTPLLSVLITWLAEMLLLLRKICCI